MVIYIARRAGRWQNRLAAGAGREATTCVCLAIRGMHGKTLPSLVFTSTLVDGVALGWPQATYSPCDPHAVFVRCTVLPIWTCKQIPRVPAVFSPGEAPMTGPPVCNQ